MCFWDREMQDGRCQIQKLILHESCYQLLDFLFEISVGYEIKAPSHSCALQSLTSVTDCPQFHGFASSRLKGRRKDVKSSTRAANSLLLCIICIMPEIPNDIVFYGYPQSPYARKIVWYLTLRKIPFAYCVWLN